MTLSFYRLILYIIIVRWTVLLATSWNSARLFGACTSRSAKQNRSNICLACQQDNNLHYDEVREDFSGRHIALNTSCRLLIYFNARLTFFINSTSFLRNRLYFLLTENTFRIQFLSFLNEKKKLTRWQQSLSNHLQWPHTIAVALLFTKGWMKNQSVGIIIRRIYSFLFVK